MEYRQLSEEEASRLLAAAELARRMHSSVEARPRLQTPQGIFEWARKQLVGAKREEFHVLCLNSRNVLLRHVCVAVGSVDQAVVIGVGLNVRASAYPPEVEARATSIEVELGRGVDRGAVLAAVLAALCDRLAVLERSPSDILQAWRGASSSAIGTRVEWDGRHGTTAGIDESGALLVKTATGIERVIAGELHWHL